MRFPFFLSSIALFLGCSADKMEMESALEHASASDFRLIPDSKILSDTFSSCCMELNDCGHNQIVFNCFTQDKSIFLELWNGSTDEFNCRPYFVSKNCLGNSLDTLFISHRTCYSGTDSDFNPLLELRADRTILISDRGTYHDIRSELITLENGEEVIGLIGESKLFVNTFTYVLKTNGQFEYTDYSQVIYHTPPAPNDTNWVQL